jgi:hypothetical protein
LIETAIWAKWFFTFIAPPNTLSMSGAIHACSFAATFTVTITYGAAFRTQYSIADITPACRNAVVTKDFAAVITQTHWLANVFTRHLTAFRTRHDWTTFATEHLLTGPAHFYVTLGRILFHTPSTKAIHALIASEFLQAILVHPFLSFAAPTDALIALGAITAFR